MIRTLAWKEYREQRGLWIAIAVMVAGSVFGIISPHGFAFQASANGFTGPALASSREMI